jgi:hypothetical protein
MREPYLSQRLNAPGFSHTWIRMLKKGFEGRASIASLC